MAAELINLETEAWNGELQILRSILKDGLDQQ